jgi:uncharacterized protein YgbK (DUF1537 family)
MYALGAANELADELTHGHVVLSTSRDVVVGHDGVESLAIARRVSTALASVVNATVRNNPLRYLVAKGGITSHDVFTGGLGASRAMVLGSLLPGIISVWRAEDGLDPGLPYVVFAGNVGDDDSLLDVTSLLESDLPETVQ